MAEHDAELPKSKSQLKREREALRLLGRELVELPDAHLQKVPLGEKSREAIVAARGMKMGALKRQLQYIGGLMVEEDEPAIRRTLEGLNAPHREEVAALHELEQWRDRLIEGDEVLLNELVDRFAQADRQHLRQLVRNAAKERKLAKPPKSSRMLFRYLYELRSDG